MRRHLVTKGSFYVRLADHGHEIVCDDDLASDEETSRRTRVDADWKAAPSAQEIPALVEADL